MKEILSLQENWMGQGCRLELAYESRGPLGRRPPEGRRVFWVPAPSGKSITSIHRPLTVPRQRRSFEEAIRRELNEAAETGREGDVAL